MQNDTFHLHIGNLEFESFRPLCLLYFIYIFFFKAIRSGLPEELTVGSPAPLLPDTALYRPPPDRGDGPDRRGDSAVDPARRGERDEEPERRGDCDDDHDRLTVRIHI